jgi:hypothetical protein
MTTKVVVACPQGSHWSLKVTVQDDIYDFATKKMTGEWSNGAVSIIDPGRLLPETYVHASRRLIIEEIETVKLNEVN